jgi:hypothetical protein
MAAGAARPAPNGEDQGDDAGALARSFVQVQDQGVRIRSRRGSQMRRLRSRAARAFVLWTLLMLVVAILLSVQATGSLIFAGQDCFMNYPAVPCPSASDPAIVRLTFVFFGVPLIWLGGIGLAVAWRALRMWLRRPR